MLPGVKGFNRNDHLNLTLLFHLPGGAPLRSGRTDRTGGHCRVTGRRCWGRWAGEIASAQRLGGAAGGWQMHRPPKWPPRMSFDDPYPLYISWIDPHSALLAPWKARMQSYPRLQTRRGSTLAPVAPWNMAGGLLAVRDLTLGEPLEAPQIDDKDDYYSATSAGLAGETGSALALWLYRRFLVSWLRARQNVSRCKAAKNRRP